jgi:KaiC/GvpD/RAD55 family RecA-like ATPase
MKRYVQIGTQQGTHWTWSELTEENEADRLIDLKSKKAYFKTTFAVEADDLQIEQLKGKANDGPEIKELFERAPKTGDLFFDFDNADLAKAKADCDHVRTYLHDSLGVPKEGMRTYESGGKGYHLMVAASCIGLSPRPDLHLLYGKIAKALYELTPNRTLDLKIYNSRRMFRVEGSTHQRTGKKKSLVEGPGTWPEGMQLSVNLKKILEAPDIKEAEIRKHKKRIPAEFFHEPLDCIRSVMENGADEGTRNDTVYTVALYWKSLGLSQQSVENRILASALHLISGVPKAEIVTTVNSAFKSDNVFGFKGSVLEPLVTEKDRMRWKKSKVDEEYESYAELVERYLGELDNPKQLVGKYYVSELDKRTGGIVGGELVVIGGTTGTGKSEFAYNVAYQNSLRGVPAAFVSLELDNLNFVSRRLRFIKNISAERLFTLQLDEEEKAQVRDTLEPIRVQNPPLYFRKSKSLLGIDELERLIQNLILEQQCRLLVIDHLHYLATNKKYESENQNVAYSIRSINSLAVKYGVGIIVVAHFRKQPDNQHKASLHEFRDSSAIEQEASTVLLLWRNLDAIGDAQYDTEIRIAKTRKDIPLSTVITKFDPSTRSYN